MLADVAVADAVTRRVGALARELRRAGARTGVGQLLRAHEALSAVDAADAEQAYLALRASLCSSQGELARFDGAYRRAFGVALPQNSVEGAGRPQAIDATVCEGRDASSELLEPSAYERGDDEDPEPVARARASWQEVLRRKDFAAMTRAERAEAERLVRALATATPLRRSSRRRRAHGHRGMLDPSATLRAALHCAGEPVRLVRRVRVLAPRRLVLVCDVSGSMAEYAGPLLHYAHASLRLRPRVEAFTFGTRLTRVTPALRERDPDAAVRRVTHVVADWSGGTRIGEAIAQLNRAYVRFVGRGALVLILSDGWETGDPELLAAELARLRRTSYRLVWCNPLKGHAGYEPLAAGMASALRYVDHFLEGHDVRAYERLARLIGGVAHG